MLANNNTSRIGVAAIWGQPPIAATLVLMAPVGVWTGSLFPWLLSLPQAQGRLISIYVLDAVGALMGGALTFGSQFLWGFRVFNLLVGVEVAVLAILLWAAPIYGESPKPSEE